MKQICNVWRILLAIVVFSAGLQAQTQRDYAWEVGAGIGSTNYYGDVSNYRIHHLKDVYRVYRFLEFNRHYVNKPSFSILAHKKLNNTVGILLQANALQFSMGDRYRRANGEIDEEARQFSRSLNFQTNLYDVGFAITLNLNNGWVFKENARIYPSFHVGLGLSTFNVKGDLFDQNGMAYDYRLPGHINDGKYETNLRELNTENDKRYNNVAPYLNLGLALNIRLTPRIGLALQSDLKYAGTDYLDDVSKTYKTNYPNAASAYAARPGYNTVDPTTLQRGDNNGVNDIYINNRIVVLYRLHARKKRREFKAPVVYAIRRASIPGTDSVRAISQDTTPSVLSKRALSSARTRIADSIRNADALRRFALRPDSTTKFANADSAFRRTINTRLDSIQRDLREIKTVIRNQALISRYRHLQLQHDSVNRLSERLLVKGNDSVSLRLQQRVYELQKDSLQNEMRTLLWLSQYPANEPDTTKLEWYPMKLEPGQSDSMGMVYQMQLQRLQHRLDSLQEIEGVAGGNNDRQQNRFTDAGKDSASTLHLPERHVIRPDSTQLVEERTLQELEREDQLLSVDDEQFDSLQTAVQANSAALQNMQLKLKASRDSAAYYRRTLYAKDIDDADTVVLKTKWYERILPRSRKEREREDEITEARNLKRQQAYFEDLVRNMSRNIEQLQRDNRSLENDYERVRRSRNNRVVNRTPTVVVPLQSNSANRQEINALREEIGELRARLSNRDTFTQRATVGIAPVTQPVQQTAQQNAQQPTRDSAVLAALRTDILSLQQKLDSIRRTPPNATKLAEPVYDVSDFPVISVYFAMNAATLPATQIDKLAPMVSAARRNKEAKIVLKGFADAVGNVRANKAIAVKRVEYVRNVLVTRYGLTAAQIIAEEPDIPVITGVKRANPLDRRVDLQFQ